MAPRDYRWTGAGEIGQRAKVNKGIKGKLQNENCKVQNPEFSLMNSGFWILVFILHFSICILHSSV